MTPRWQAPCPYCKTILAFYERLTVRTRVRCPNIRRPAEFDASDYAPLGAAHPASTTTLLRRTGRATWPHSGGCGREFVVRPLGAR